MTTKMQSCVDHIKTSLDVDPWAMELVEKIFAEYDRRFDKVLEIIDKHGEQLVHNIVDGRFPEIIAADVLASVREDVLALKGGEL